MTRSLSEKLSFANSHISSKAEERKVIPRCAAATALVLLPRERLAPASPDIP